MLKDGSELFYASLIIGLSRLIPVLISTFWGQLVDRLPPKLTVLVSELLAAAASIGILLTWDHGNDAYWLLLIFCVLKASVVTFQAATDNAVADNAVADNAVADKPLQPNSIESYE